MRQVEWRFVVGAFVVVSAPAIVLTGDVWEGMYYAAEAAVFAYLIERF